MKIIKTHIKAELEKVLNPKTIKDICKFDYFVLKDITSSRTERIVVSKDFELVFYTSSSVCRGLEFKNCKDFNFDELKYFKLEDLTGEIANIINDYKNFLKSNFHDFKVGDKVNIPVQKTFGGEVVAVNGPRITVRASYFKTNQTFIRGEWITEGTETGTKEYTFFASEIEKREGALI